MADNKRIAKNTIFLYFRMILVMGIHLYTSRVVLRNLGVEDYGIYNVVGGIVTMFTFLAGSLGSATSRYLTFELGRKDFDRLKKLFNISLLIHIAIGIIIVILAETIGVWFFYEKMVLPEDRLDAAMWVYQVSIITTLVSLTQVPYNATIIAHENMKVYAWEGIVEVFVQLLIVISLAHAPFDKLIYFAWMIFFLKVGVSIFYRIYCTKRYAESRLRFYRDKALYRELFGYAGSDLIGSISVLAQGQGLNLLLNLYFGPVVNAARAIAYQVQGAISQFSNNFMTAVRPQIIKLYAEGKPKEMMELAENSSCFSFYLLWVISYPLMLESDYVLSLWLGEYPEHTTTFLKLVMMLCLIQSLKTPRSTVYHATGHLKFTNIVVGSILCCAFPLAYLFLEIGLSAESVFWAANICMIISEFVSVFILKRYVSYSATKYLVNVHGRCALVVLLSGLVPFLLYKQFMEQSFLRLVLTCIITTLSICIVVCSIGMKQNVKKKVLMAIKNKINTIWNIPR